MKRSNIEPMPQFFDRYINQVDDEDIIEALEKLLPEKIAKDEITLLDELGDKRYAEGKWTVKDILQHIIDNERIQSYRALRFARDDKNSLPGYDEKLYGLMANASHRTVSDLLKELQAVRESTIDLFKSFNQEMLQRKGICYNVTISVLALGFVIAGHHIHHFKVIKEKYYPLLNNNKIF